MFSILPREHIFFDLFEQAAGNVHEGALALAELLKDFTDVAGKAQKIKDIEHAGDKITHATIEKLNKTFITPIEREDIHELTSRLDDVLDLIDSAVSRIMLYKIAKPTEDARAMAQVLVESTRIIMDLLPRMRNLKRSKEIVAQCIEVHTQENEGDRILHRALAQLFEDGHDAATIIKWKDIYENLEAASDRCEDVANVVEGIVLKNA